MIMGCDRFRVMDKDQKCENLSNRELQPLFSQPNTKNELKDVKKGIFL